MMAAALQQAAFRAKVVYDLVYSSRKGEAMAEITRFYGITVKMFFANQMPYSATIHDDGSVEVFGNINDDEPKEHDAAHIWAIYDEKVGVFDIDTSQMIEGDLPQRAQDMVCKWLAANKEPLLRMWESQKVESLPPLE